MIQLVNNHVLFPHPANWRVTPKWQRAWQNQISPAVTGHESRVALRSQPRVALSVLVTPWDVPTQNQLDDRIYAAQKSGLACMPYWGRGSVLSQDCSDASPYLKFSNAFWNWQAGQYVFFLHEPNPGIGGRAENFEVRQLAELSVNGWSLDQAPARTIEAGKICWPLIFGKFSSAEMEAESDERGAMMITVSEMVPAVNPTIGAVNLPPATGIGAMAVNDDFTVNAP